jgi:hypothetical protein
MTDTALAPRIAGMRGLIGESHQPELMLTQFTVYTGLEAEPLPPTWDGTHGITQNGMDGNDRKGCCGAAMTDHYNVYAAGSTALINTLGQPKYNGVLPTYYAYGIAQGEPGPEPDQGVDNASWFAWLYKMGIIEGYAEVPIDQIRRYAVQFGGVCIGQRLPDQADSDFQAEPQVPWGSPGEVPDPNDGHDTLFIAFDESGGKVATWGGLQPVTNEYLDPANGFITDAWVVFDKETAEEAGYDWNSIQEALTELHGEVTPIDPAPTPAPKPIPEIPSSDFEEKVQQLAEEAITAARNEISRLEKEIEIIESATKMVSDHIPLRR